MGNITYKDLASVMACGQFGATNVTAFDAVFTFGKAKAMRLGRVSATAAIALRHSETQETVIFQVGDYDVIPGSWDMVISASTTGVTNLIAFY